LDLIAQGQGCDLSAKKPLAEASAA
jgi:hypothetical protein